MKRKFVLVSFLMAMTMFCVSCGTRLPETSDYAAGDSASGSAVKAENSASGSAVKAENSEGKYDRYPFCNEDNYYQFEGNKLVQGRLDGTVIKKYPVKGVENVGIWRVNEKEILYVDDRGEQYELWSIPLKKDADGAVPQMDEAEMILTDNDDIVDVYANDDYIVYMSDSWFGTYNEYDRRQKKRIPVDREGKRTFVTYTGEHISSVIGDGYILLGEAFESSDKNFDDEEETSEGVYIHKIGSGRVAKIGDGDWFLSNVNSVAGARASGEKFFFGGVGKKVDESKDEYDYDTEDSKNVWVYDVSTGKKELYISEEQFMQCIKESKISFDEEINYLILGQIYIDSGKIYVSCSTGSDFFIVSRELEGDSKLQCDEKLCKFLNEEIDYGKYMLSEENIIDGKLLVTYREKGEGNDGVMTKCYDLAKRTYKDVTEGEPELVYWYYGV